MSEKPFLDELLGKYIKMRGFKGGRRLANQVNRNFGDLTISEHTINNWRKGLVQSIKYWQPFVAVLAVLQLNESQANELLTVAKLPSLNQLWAEAEEEDKRFLVGWMVPAQSGATILRSPVSLALFNPEETIPNPGPLPTGSRLPLAANPIFVGREEELRRLARELEKGVTVTIGQTVAATGLGGIGKTQLAVEFAHRYGRHFPGGVFC